MSHTAGMNAILSNARIEIPHPSPTATKSTSKKLQIANYLSPQEQVIVLGAVESENAPLS